MYLRRGVFYYVHAIDGRWERLGTDLALARKKAEAYSAGAAVFGTVAYWLDAWLKELDRRVVAGTLAPRTRDDYGEAVDLLKTFFGRMDPADVRPPHVAEYLDLGRDAGRAVRANRERAALSSCFTWLVRTGVVGTNPCRGVQRNTERPRDRHVTDEEFAAVYALASPPVKAWMQMMYRTLQRPADVLQWTYGSIVDLHDGSTALQFRQGKTRRMMTILINEDIESALAAVREARGGRLTGPLIPREDGQRYTQSGLNAMFRRHVAAAGASFALYDIKAKGATDMYADGVPLETISALCGHTSVKTTEIYIKTHVRAPVAPNARKIASRRAA